MRQEWVDVVGNQQRSYVSRADNVVDEMQQIRFAPQIKVRERLVKQEYIRLAHKRLGKKYPLQFSTGQNTKGAMCKFGRADTFQRCHGGVIFLFGKRVETPFFPRESKSHQFKAFNISITVYYMALRNVANLRISALWRRIEYL